MVDIIADLPSMDGSLLRIPLADDMYEKFKSMFLDEERKCNNLIDQLIIRAKG